MEREGMGGFELLVIVVAGIALALVGAVWAGAWLALAASGGGHLPFAAAADAAPTDKLVDTGSDEPDVGSKTNGNQSAPKDGSKPE